MIPAHHAPDGRFRNPWNDGPERPPGGFLTWALAHRSTRPAAKDPPRDTRQHIVPPNSVTAIDQKELAITWIGHSTFLIQIGGRNLLTDPVWSERASPIRWLGPRRRSRPGVPLAALPEIHAVVLSHDHYDHLDARTVRRLVAAHPRATWLAPLRVGGRLRAMGAQQVRELDWWQQDALAPVTFTCVPARHWSGRSLRDRGATLWCGWLVTANDRVVFFAGDTAHHPELARIARWAGRLDVALLPIGGYEPSWYMRHVHLSPEEAVQAYVELTSAVSTPERTVMVPMHWGTFKLADEAMDEPPRRLRDAWRAAGLPSDALWVARPGETRRW